MASSGTSVELGIDLKYYVLRAQSSSVAPVDFSMPDTEPKESTGKDHIHWIEVAGGLLAARARPQDASALEAWGCTALVSLIEDGQAMKSAADELGVKWVHAPVEPISNARKGVSVADYDSFRKVDEVLALLKGGLRVVVHCQAGCHRTGIFCYVLLRSAGFSPEDSMSAIRQTREITWSELTAITKKRPRGLEEKAEGIFTVLQFSHAGSNQLHAQTVGA